jgi:hypothetical protein
MFECRCSKAEKVSLTGHPTAGASSESPASSKTVTYQMPIELTQKFSKPSAVLAQELLDGDVVLLHVDSGQYFGLDRVGNEAWKVLVTGATLEDARDQLLSQFDVAPGQLMSDLEALITELTSNGLLELADP